MPKKDKNRKQYFKRNAIPVPKYFYMTYDPFLAYWFQDPVEKSIELKSFKWPIHSECTVNITLCCDFEMAVHMKNPKYEPPKKNLYRETDLPILKSHLQKTVRQENIKEALNTAYSMITIHDTSDIPIGIIELFRRIPIIMIEDLVPSPFFPAFVWIMVAISLGYIPSESIIKTYLQTIYEVFSCHWQDKGYDFEHVESEVKLDEELSIIDLPEAQQDILWSLQLRKSYGGMAGDLIMLDKVTHLWLRRLYCQHDTISYYRVRYYNISSEITLSYLSPSDMVLEAFDFHCTPIAKRISKMLGLDEYDIRDLIWTFASSINKRIEVDFIAHRQKIKKKDKIMWDLIREKVYDEMKELKNEFIIKFFSRPENIGTIPKIDLMNPEDAKKITKGTIIINNPNT
jgi:hypothetical protein